MSCSLIVSLQFLAFLKPLHQRNSPKLTRHNDFPKEKDMGSEKADGFLRGTGSQCPSSGGRSFQGSRPWAPGKNRALHREGHIRARLCHYRTQKSPSSPWVSDSSSVQRKEPMDPDICLRHDAIANSRVGGSLNILSF